MNAAARTGIEGAQRRCPDCGGEGDWRDGWLEPCALARYAVAIVRGAVPRAREVGACEWLAWTEAAYRARYLCGDPMPAAWDGAMSNRRYQVDIIGQAEILACVATTHDRIAENGECM